MSDYSQKVSGSFNERMRLIRLRRKKENLHFWEEFRIIPNWLIWLVVAKFLLAQFIGQVAIHAEMANGGYPWPELQGRPGLTSLAVAGIIMAVSLCMAAIIFLIAYVNRDAARRGMSAALWTILVIILLPAWGFIGFVIYFLMREPLPYPCPLCGNSVGARFNFCPNCKCNLHPSCAQCKREVVETDKFCPYCGNDLKIPPSPIAEAPSAA